MFSKLRLDEERSKRTDPDSTSIDLVIFNFTDECKTHDRCSSNVCALPRKLRHDEDGAASHRLAVVKDNGRCQGCRLHCAAKPFYPFEENSAPSNTSFLGA